MAHPYRLKDEAGIFSPALLFFPQLIEQNIARIIELAGSPDRLRPHAKTHKTRQIAQMQLAAGVTKHKCATIAEAELMASCGVPDVLIAYPLVGPNVNRLSLLAQQFPTTQFSALIDCPAGADELSEAAISARRSLGFLVDLDVGQHRTGIAIGDEAALLYAYAAQRPGLRAEGLHAYDGQNNHESRAEREASAHAGLERVISLRQQIEEAGFKVPRIVAGGTPSFPVYAEIHSVPGLECSPGTYVLHDFGYGSKYADLTGVIPAAVLLTRVISRPTPTRVTFDLGTKAVASDPVMARRVHLLDVPAYEIVGHNEEHLVVEMSAQDAAIFIPGDVVYALPGHVCPTVALHRDALAVENGVIVDRWPIIARDRALTV